MTDPKGTWSDGGKVWEGRPAVGGEAAAWEKRWPGKEWEPIMEPTPDHLTRLINSGREVRPLYAAQPASPLRVTGAINLVEEAACLIWSELCPGMVMGDDDIPHYEAAAKAVLALPASPLRGREALAKMFLSMWKNGSSPLQIADAMLATQPASPLPAVGGEAINDMVRKIVYQMSPADQYDLAFKVAENVGYMLVRESEHPDSPHLSASPPEQPAAVPTNGYEVAYQALKKAGDALSFAAQTSGGTAGRDDGLMTAIGDWQIAKDKARAMRRIEKFEPAAVLSAIPETGRESIREIVYANAQTTLIGFNEISDQNVEFICDQISRMVELALSAPEQPAADPVAEREWMSIASPHTVKMLLDTITAKNARIGELEEALGKAVLAPVTGRMCPYCFGLGKIENPTDPDEELPKARPMEQS